MRHQIITAENVDHFYPNDSLLGVSSGTPMDADRISFREAKYVVPVENSGGKRFAPK